jgi:hypothetical protein
MSAIYVLVHRVFEAGYLSLEVESHLKKLMTHGCDEEDTEVCCVMPSYSAMLSVNGDCVMIE